MKTVLLLPGIGNTGPDHWQSKWESLYPNVSRVQQSDWLKPNRDRWIEALDLAIAACASPPVLVAHSLGCLLFAHWAVRSNAAVDSALLVAPPDPQSPAYPKEAMGFSPLPLSIARPNVTIVSSSNDVYSSDAFAAQCARHWGAEHISLGDFGHVNAASGLGNWDAGWSLIKRRL